MDTFILALFGLALAAGVFAVTLVLPIWSFVRTSRLRAEVKAVRQSLERLAGSVEQLRASSRDASRGEPVMATLTAEPRPGPGAPAATPLPAPAVAGPAQPQPRPPATPVAPSVSTPVAAIAVAVPAAVSAPPRVPAAQADTLETRIGGHWLLYIGMATLVLGLGFFIKYAFDNEWISETMRVALGGLAGLVMISGGLALARRNYALYGEIVAGGGFVTLYLSTYAALNFYDLISRPVAFGLMVVITAASAVAADRQRALGLAVVALVGGFGTPFLVGGGEDAQVVLLTYDALLVAGTIVLAQRREWPWLNLVSYALTAFTFLAWASEYYTSAKYGTTEFFLTLFCGMFLYMYVQTRRLATRAANITSWVLLSAPVVYHLASLDILRPHGLPLLVYLTLSMLGGVLASVRLDKAWLRLVTFALTTLPLLSWLDAHTGSEWRLAGLVVLVAMYAMPLVAIGERLTRHAGAWPRADLALFHASGMALFGGLYMLVDAMWPQMTPLLALGLAAWYAGLAWYSGQLHGDARLNSLAMGFAMAGFAIGLQFDDWWAVVGWAVESAAIVWVGLKSRRDWMRLGGAALLAVTLARLFDLGFFDTPSWFTAVWNPRVGATLAIVAICYLLAALHKRLGREQANRAAPEIATFLLAANLLTILLVTTEINFFFGVRESEDATADLARMATLSIAWAVYGVGLIVVGINRRYAPIRYLAIALLTLTIAKVFLVDLNELGGLYRIVGFVGLGLFLLLGAWLYQRYRGLILGRED